MITLSLILCLLGHPAPLEPTVAPKYMIASTCCCGPNCKCGPICPCKNKQVKKDRQPRERSLLKKIKEKREARKNKNNPTKVIIILK